MGNAFFIQANNITIDKSVPTPANAVAFNTVVEAGADNGAYTWIHSWSIAAAGKYADSFYAHFENLQSKMRKIQIGLFY